MNVFLIPEMLNEILSWCTYQEKVRILRLNKKIYIMIDVENKKKIKEKARYEYHLQLGNYLCRSNIVVSHMLFYVCELLGKSHKLAKWLYVLDEIFLTFKCTLDSVACVQCPNELRAIYCYYNNRKGEKTEPILKMLDLVSRGKRKRPVQLNMLEMKLWYAFVDRLFEITDKLKFFNDDDAYDILKTSTIKTTQKQYKRFVSFTNKWSLLTIGQHDQSDSCMYIK